MTKLIVAFRNFANAAKTAVKTHFTCCFVCIRNFSSVKGGKFAEVGREGDAGSERQEIAAGR